MAESGANIRDRGAGSIPKPPTLKTIPVSGAYFFCKKTYKAQMDFAIPDKIKTGSERSLPANEKLAMALNEVAASRKAGFFLHIRNRDCWKKFSDSEVLCPPERELSRPR